MRSAQFSTAVSSIFCPMCWRPRKMPIDDTECTRLAPKLFFLLESRMNYDSSPNPPFCRWIWLKRHNFCSITMISASRHLFFAAHTVKLASRHFFLLKWCIFVNLYIFCTITVNSALIHCFSASNYEFSFTSRFFSARMMNYASHHFFSAQTLIFR